MRTFTSSRSFQPARNFIVNGIEIAARTVRQNLLDQRQIAQQARAAVARHHFLHRAAEVDIDDVEAHDPGNTRAASAITCGIGAEQLRRDRMLVGIEIQVAEASASVCVAPHRCATTPCELVNSVMISPQPPWLRIRRRKTVSVTPAMGASTVAGAIRIGPIGKLVGKARMGIAKAILTFRVWKRNFTPGRQFEV